MSKIHHFHPRATAMARAVSILLGLSCALPALADGDDSTPATLGRVEVTGSSIKRINGETASPVQVVNRQQIEDMGAKTVTQILANLPAALPALTDDRGMFTGTDGASQANLRGLGAQSTLVLLNGRRVAPYGAPDGFQYLFVNIDTIPAAAIERVEVLTDGASAIYGSDAVAGVINIITRKSYQGFEVNVDASKSPHISAYGEGEASAVFGIGDLTRDRYNVYGSVNYYHRDAIYPADQYDKFPAGYYEANPNYITNFHIKDGSQPGQLNPGSYFAFDPVTGAKTTQASANCKNVFTSGSNTSCVANTLPYALANTPSSDRATVYLAGRYEASESLEAFADLSFTQISVRSHNSPRTFNSGSTSNWFSRDTGLTLNTFAIPYLGPNNVYNQASPALKAMMGGVVGLNYLPLDNPNHFGQRNEDANYRATAGLRGSVADWDYETGLTLAGTHSTLYQTTNISISGFQKAFGPLTIDPGTGRTIIADNPAYKFGQNSPENAALLDAAFPTFDIQSYTRLATWDGKVEGKLGALPAGDVRAAFGFNVAHEYFFTPGNAQAAAGDITQQGGSWFKGSRNVLAVFGETVLPITKALEADAAVRVDKYPNFAANVAPKLGLKFRATPELLLRGTYSEGFRAPGLAESGTGGVYAQTVLRDTVRCGETNAIANLLLKSANPVDVDNGKSLLNSNCSTVIGGVTAPNPALKPETAKISTLGVVFQPNKNFDISADYFFVKRKDEIIREDFAETYRLAIAKYGPGLVGAPNATRSAITDADRANAALAAAACANPANAAICTGAVPGYTVGNLAGIVTNYVNRGGTLVDGFDLDAQSHWTLGAYGRLNVGLKATILNRTIYDSGDGSGWSQNWVGLYERPKLTAVFNADWQYREVTTSVLVNYTGSRKWKYSPDDDSFDPGNCSDNYPGLSEAQCAAGIPAYVTTNLNIDWQAKKNLKLGLNIRNLFGKQPSYDPNGYEGFNHRDNIEGRIFTLSASYKFW